MLRLPRRADLTYFRSFAIIVVMAVSNAAVAQEGASPAAKPSHTESTAKPAAGVAQGGGKTAGSARPAENATSKAVAVKAGSKELYAPKTPITKLPSKAADKSPLNAVNAPKGSSAGPATRGNDGSAGKSGTRSGNNEIDTRITVQPHSPLKPAPKANVTSIAPKSPNLVPQSITHESVSPMRNATGVLVSTPRPAKAPIPTSAPPAAYGSTAGAAGLSVFSGVANSARQAAGSNLHAWQKTNNGAITGTGVTRPGTGAGIIGGPAKTVAGINGTTIRPRQP